MASTSSSESSLTNLLDRSSPTKQKLAVKRTVSVARAEEILHEDKKERRNSPDKPFHCPRDSLFSSSSGYNNYRGFFNLAILLLVLSNARVALENVIKYGILVDPLQWVYMAVKDPYRWPSFSLVLGVNVYILTSFYIELWQAKGVLTDRVALALKIVNEMTILVIPSWVILSIQPNPIGAAVAVGFHSIVFLKLWSYHEVNRWCRDDARARSRRHARRGSVDLFMCTPSFSNGDVRQDLVRYPNNLTLKDMYYFMLAPTLCYELNFPRSTRIRKTFLFRRIAEMVILSQLQLMMIQQWMMPTVNNSMKPISEMNFSRMVERLLKLAIPNHIIWLIFFYCSFHSSLNVVAELLRFSDRQFYLDWWNAATINDFWSRWNIPVHQFALRHVFRPMLKLGYSKRWAAVAVFVMSAFFHEFLVSVPLNMFRIWAFLAMILQIPFSLIVSRISKIDWKYGNAAVWLSLIIGQPIAILMYVHDYYVNTMGWEK